MNEQQGSVRADLRRDESQRALRSHVPWRQLVPVVGVLILSGWVLGASRTPEEPTDSVAAIQQLDAARAPGFPSSHSRTTSNPRELVGAGLPASGAHDATLTTPLSELSAACERCHRFPHGLSHPVGVHSSITPSDLPLDAGRVTCLTCHDERAVRPHDRQTVRAGRDGAALDEPNAASTPSALPSGMTPRGTGIRAGAIEAFDERAGTSAAFLRTDSVDAMCAACHQASAGGGRNAPRVAVRSATGGGHMLHHPDPALNDVHAMGLLRAHLAGSSTRRGGGGSMERVSRLTGSALGVDGESASCLSCHDGTVASDVGGHSERRPDGSSQRNVVIRAVEMEGSNSHPIGVLYRSSAGAHGIELKSAASLDPRIRLFDQRVGCGSCHSMYSKEPKYQVLSNDRSALCLSCHRM